ncbi:hypothetical protein NLJ89_g9983 [Agrocybe chaxingu]|uniref:Uncharacterized protein n=1 Tax=Agrocybe chaxingu TaxID=84603 RepID=A0A9W8MSJ7_9AGAR|nr:hypothetical protein NLJ89_g9983 [Agrocybe chaxingu]
MVSSQTSIISPDTSTALFPEEAPDVSKPSSSCTHFSPFPRIQNNFRNPWYIAAAVAFSASNRPEGVPRVFEHALAGLRSANTNAVLSQSGREEEERLLAQNMREAVFQSALICGYPRAINGLMALHEVTPEELREKKLLRNPDVSLAGYEVMGNTYFKTVYGEKAEEVMEMLDAVYPDLGWSVRTTCYGLVYVTALPSSSYSSTQTQTCFLTPLEISYTLVAALIAVDTPRQIAWNLDGARRVGASVEELSSVREVIERVITLGRGDGLYLKALFPENASRNGLRNPWYIVAAVAFSASNRPEGVRRVFEHVLADLRSANASSGHSQTVDHQSSDAAQLEERVLARKMREALFKSGLICGYPRAINGLKALHEVMPEELKEEKLLRDPNVSLGRYEEVGNAFFKTVYGEKAEEVMGMLDTVYPDLGTSTPPIDFWGLQLSFCPGCFSRTIGYGLVYSPTATQTEILSPLETSYTLVAALIAVDTPQQIVWHLDGARRGGGERGGGAGGERD